MPDSEGSVQVLGKRERGAGRGAKMVQHPLTVGDFARRQAARERAAGMVQAIEQGQNPLT